MTIAVRRSSRLGNPDASGLEVFHGLVAPPMAELQFEGPSAEGEGEQLVTQADAEDRDAANEVLRRGNGRPEDVRMGGIDGALTSATRLRVSGWGVARTVRATSAMSSVAGTRAAFIVPWERIRIVRARVSAPSRAGVSWPRRNSARDIALFGWLGAAHASLTTNPVGWIVSDSIAPGSTP